MKNPDSTALENLSSATETEFCDPKTRFEVHDETSANWVVRKILEARAYRQRIRTWAEVEVRRAERQEQFFLGRFGRQLDRWLRSQLETRQSRQRSINLPAGRVGLRKQKPKLIVDDPEAVLEWAKQVAPNLVTVQESVSKSDLNSHLEQTGEFPARGVHLDEGGDRLVVQ